MQLTDKQNEYIDSCIRNSILPKNVKIFEAFYFGSTKKSSEHLYQLILSGKKKATTSALASFKNGIIPKVGDISLIISYKGSPLALIQTTQVLVTTFNHLTYDQIKDEGECETLESWRFNHQDFFMRDGLRNAYAFSEDMPVVFEHFKVIHIK